MTREPFAILTADALIREQIEHRRKLVALYQAKGKTLARRGRKKRDRLEQEIDALQAELDRRTSGPTTCYTTTRP